jgi:hypothetical protein
MSFAADTALNPWGREAPFSCPRRIGRRAGLRFIPAVPRFVASRWEARGGLPKLHRVAELDCVATARAVATARC